MQNWQNLAYLGASVLMIYTFMGLAHPRTAMRANLIGALGMTIAILATFVQIDVWPLVLIGIPLGSLIGAILALRIRMTGMPQMVALLNGFGGLASVLVAGAYLIGQPSVDLQTNVATAASGFIGAVTFWGSLVAWDKLEEFLLKGGPILFPGRHVVNVILILLVIGLSFALVMDPTRTSLYWWLCLVSSLLGIGLTIPIGGADMPVVIALLNSYSGLAAAATGFVLKNNMLIIAGSLVGASGVILTAIMCKAMNRSLANVMFAGVGSEVTSGPKADDVYAGKIKATSPEEIAMVLDGASRVVIVPGYGMAVAQAQHAVKTLATLLEKRGVTVDYAIHPVAGRMPGHMNILLAEADVAYDKLLEMDVINPSFPQTDVAIVIGANDVVNPLARTDPTSPIAGMPILDVDRAKTVIMIKRSLSPGFAGIPNPLFAAPNCLMFFSDGKNAINDIISAVKES